MSRYSTYGNLDDRIEQAGDVGFLGFNNRLRPNQLQAGMLADAQNIRMDRNGQAQVRRGVDLVVAPLSVGSALTLPFFMGGNVNAGSFVTSRKYSTVAFQTGTGAATDFKDLGATYANEKTASSPVATANTLTITVTGHGRSVGDEVILASSSNGSTAFSAGSSSTNIDGARTVATVPDANTLTFTITGITNGETITTTNPRVYDSKTYEFTATGAGSNTGTATSEELTVTATSDGGTLDITSTNTFTNFPSSGTINISDASGISADPNGDRTFTKASASEIQVTDQNYSSGSDSSVTLKFGILNDNDVNNIYGSTDFSDPNAESSQYILVASNTKAVGYNLDTTATFDIGYPSGITYTGDIEMMQAMDKVFLFQGGKTALENNLRISTISAASLVSIDDTDAAIADPDSNSGNLVITNITGSSYPDSGTINLSNVSGISNPDPNGDQSYTKTGTNELTVSGSFTGAADNAVTVKFGVVTVTTSSAHNLASGEKVTISNLTGSDLDPTPNGSFTISGLGASDGSDTATKFRFELTGDNATYTVTSNPIVATDFTNVASGEFTQPKLIDLTDIDYAAGVGTATASTSDIALLSVGDTLIFRNAGTSTYSVNDTIVVSSIPSTTTFKFVTNKEDAIDKTAIVQTKISVGLGYIRMPAPPFAAYHERRLFMPFQFIPTGSASSNTFDSRNVVDELIVSQFKDTDKYDQVKDQFRFNAGTSDFIVGLHSFAEDRLLVFNRNTIHAIQGTLDIDTSVNRLITDEVGCVARKTIEQVGNQIIFLSDNGVYSTQFFDEYNLRGTETPLSEPINESIQRINKNAQENAVAVYFDNRYYIAVPLDDSTSNNAVLIYNFLNKQWESIDTVNNANYHITNLLIVGSGDKRGVYSVNDIGGVHRLDHRVDGVDRVSTQIGSAEENILIPGSLTTRQYTFGTLDRKRWKEFDVHIQSSDTNTSDLNIDFETENPDDTGSIGTLSGFNGEALAINEDVSIRGRIGNRRGYGIQFTINNTVGRPIIRGIEVQGATTMRSTNKAI